MKVAICQYDMSWEDAASNLRTVERLVERADADLVVLPEMFSTGFKLHASVVAEPMSGPTIAAMREWSRRYGKAIVGSVVIVDDEGRFRNRQFFVKPSGEMTWYDKRHLFRPGGEGRDYTAGTERVVVEYGGVRFLLQVCYDLRFPVWSRNRGDYDAIIYSASWAADRREAWRLLLRARAVENQAFVLGVGPLRGRLGNRRFPRPHTLRGGRRGGPPGLRTRLAGHEPLPRRLPGLAGCGRFRDKNLTKERIWH